MEGDLLELLQGMRKRLASILGEAKGMTQKEMGETLAAVLGEVQRRLREAPAPGGREDRVSQKGDG